MDPILAFDRPDWPLVLTPVDYFLMKDPLSEVLRGIVLFANFLRACRIGILFDEGNGVNQSGEEGTTTADVPRG